MVRYGQNLLVDSNLLEAIIREADLVPADVVLEIGAGAGVLTGRLADAASHVHAIEIDRRFEGDLGALSGRANVSVHWDDAMDVALADLRPQPGKVVSNLPYSIATPVILRTIEELPGVEQWTLMVQREIADRLRAEPGSRTYGSPSVLVQIAAEVRLLRNVDPAVFRPRPRVGSALIGLRRRGPAADGSTRKLVRGAFAHRRKSLARSLEFAAPGTLERVRKGLADLGLPADARAESLSPEDFLHLAAKLTAGR